MSKAYCKDCRFYPVGWWCKSESKHWAVHCRSIVKKEKEKTWLQWLGKVVIEKTIVGDERGERCEKANENNDCKNYKRKWWKFS